MPVGFDLNTPHLTVFDKVDNIQLYPGLTITGGVGETYRIDFMDKLHEEKTWVPLVEIGLEESTFLFVDTEAPEAHQRYYRAVKLQ